MAEMKYVVVKTEGGVEQLFTFPKTIDHDAFAEVLSHIKTGGRNWTREYREPVSAGFTDGKKCYGHSETLNLSSRGIDSDLLERGGQSPAGTVADPCPGCTPNTVCRTPTCGRLKARAHEQG